MYPIETMKANAVNDMNSGYNCAQAVLNQYCEQQGLAHDLALRIASGFGGGMRMGKTCGAVTGGIMALGLLYGFGTEYEPEIKTRMQNITVEFLEKFKAANGTTDCKEILGIDTSLPGNRELATEQGLFQQKCPACIYSAIDIIASISWDGC
jgi:C_GCAxxG_C_C family probable redox protein